MVVGNLNRVKCNTDHLFELLHVAWCFCLWVGGLFSLCETALLTPPCCCYCTAWLFKTTSSLEYQSRFNRTDFLQEGQSTTTSTGLLSVCSLISLLFLYPTTMDQHFQDFVICWQMSLFLSDRTLMSHIDSPQAV